MGFSVVEIKNCRHFVKRCYTLDFPVNTELLDKLEGYGMLELNRFSLYSPLARDSFKIQLEDILEITGVVKGHEVFILIRKTQFSVLAELEQILRSHTV